MAGTGERGRPLYDPRAGDVVVLRRGHVCGSARFAITQVGLDIRLSCLGCGRRVIVTRERLRGRVREIAGPVEPPPRPED